ncbi:MAG: hypothetical protein K0S23_1668 [Fluviicola sp.]|jgi:hypothetical protein|uniref:hypothetical protein n=1 Tax=Fluviicola sp. TaxID=1917219 RepID=UPI002636D710|nr:hypothetical protein [Fluviicola sp.]MDF3027361.1 hypothetical protein [Fluviicola sp.]
MKLKHAIIPALSIALFLLNSCGGPSKKDYSKEVDEGTFNGNTFTSQALGWTMEFPDNWIVTSKSSLESMDERSKQASGDSSDMSGIKRTLAFQKNFENNFQSSWEEFTGDKAEYKRHISNIHSMIYNNYLSQRISLDSTAGQLTVSGVTFDSYEISLYDKYNKNFANQLLLTSIVKNKFMTVTIAYNNEADKKKILGLFKKSTFK